MIFVVNGLSRGRSRTRVESSIEEMECTLLGRKPEGGAVEGRAEDWAKDPLTGYVSQSRGTSNHERHGAIRFLRKRHGHASSAARPLLRCSSEHSRCHFVKVIMKEWRVNAVKRRNQSSEQSNFYRGGNM